jgi:hypothetical protein
MFDNFELYFIGMFGLYKIVMNYYGLPDECECCITEFIQKSTNVDAVNITLNF